MMGIVIGVIPKLSVIPWVLGIIALLLPLNLVALIVTIAVFSFAGPLLDPWLHHIGYTILKDPALAEFWESMAQSQTFVWMQLNNTVVAGSVAVWLVALLPGYFICKAIVAVLRPTWNRFFGLFSGHPGHPPVMSS